MDASQACCRSHNTMQHSAQCQLMHTTQQQQQLRSCMQHLAAGRCWRPAPAHEEQRLRRQRHPASAAPLRSATPITRASSVAADRLRDAQPLPLPPEARQLGSNESGHDDDQAAASLAAAIPPLHAWGADTRLMACCEPGTAAPLRVAVLVSGGVDSSLALQLVAAAGHSPTAFYLQIWFQEDFRNFWDACPWEEDLSYARQVCEALGVELEVVPLTQAYWDRVVAHSVAEIKAGRTPNPDMLCNSRVKFGAFVEHLEQQHAGAFDRIASGHYARVVRHTPPAAADPAAATTSSSSSSDSERRASHHGASSSDSGVRLMMVPDAVKDQTYFLANLSPAQLSRCMFPLGGFTKPEVRALAAAAGLATSGRKDSQGICFLGKVKFGEFVKQHLGEWPGPLVEEDSGQVVGVHEGYWFYTVGQRGGIKLPGGPWYVVRKDSTSNTVYVSRSYYADEQRRRDAFVCGPFNWLSEVRPRQQQEQQEQQQPPSQQQEQQSHQHEQSQQQQQQQQQQPSPLLVKVRHGPAVYACRLQLGSGQEMLALLDHGSAATFTAAAASHQPGGSNNGSSSSSSSSGASGASGDHPGASDTHGLVLLDGSDQGLAAGQYAVFYQDGQCLGSAQMLGGPAGATAHGM